MSFVEIRGNLFDSSDSLAHCVGSDFVMGAGIAVEFKSRFGRQKELQKMHISTGNFAVFKHGERYIYYLVTKPKSAGSLPTYKTMEECIEKMFDDARSKRITDISMPRIGCGLDRLNWDIVKDIIKLYQGDVNVKIYFLD